MFALIFAPEHSAQFDQVRKRRIVVVGPRDLVFELGLEPPATAEFLGADLALLAVVGLSFPNVSIAHRILCGAGGAFGKNTRPLKDLAKFLIYLAAVIALGALLAPPLYWAAQALAAHGIFRFLATYKFQKFFDRAALVAAFALLLPTVRWLRIKDWRDLGLDRDAHWRRHWAAGFIISGAIVAAMAFAYVESGVYSLLPALPWGKLPLLALGAVTVGLLEEAFFRGAILGLLRRTLGPYPALFWTTSLFAIVHFLQPDKSFDPHPIGWLSGFQYVPRVFHQFAEPMTLLAGFSTLFVLGWVLGEAALRTRSLWMSMGLHTGVVFVKMSFAALSKLRETRQPWIGSELQIGLVPVALLLLAWIIVILYLARENGALPAKEL
jgi:membrane protease YdiL (CAAX protease family)